MASCMTLQAQSSNALPRTPHVSRARPPAVLPSAQRCRRRHSKHWACAAAGKQYDWTFDEATRAKYDPTLNPKVRDIPVSDIIRPLGRTRASDNAKVEALMESIQEVGLQEPITVLEVNGKIYGFSGCHRFDAHQRLGLPTIRCIVRKATPEVLKMHMM